MHTCSKNVVLCRSIEFKKEILNVTVDTDVQNSTIMDRNIDHIEVFNKKCWEEIYRRLFGGLVFIEDCCAECLHWEGGLFNLLDAGAIGVKSLSSFESGNEQQKKAVFVSRGTPANIDTIREIVLNSYFVNCILVFTANSNIVQSESNTSFIDLENQVYDWIRKKPCAVEVTYIPIFAVSVTNNIFATPLFSTLYPKFDEKILPNSNVALDLHSLDFNDKNEVRRLAASLNSLLESMKVKEDIFYMGGFSSILSGVLEHLPEAVNRRKNASKSVSIIFIDRTVDLSAVTSHTTNSLLGKMMNLLPRFPGHSIDLAVDISNLASADMVSIIDDIHLCPGSVVHQSNSECKQVFEHLINKSQMEVMFGLYNKLSNLSEASPMKLPPRITAQNLEKIVNSFTGNYDKIKLNCGLLQQSLGIIQTLKSPDMQQIELLVCLEKQVLQSITTSRDSTSVLSQISLIIKSWRQRGLTIDRILALLVNIYSLAAGYITFSEAQEKNLHDSLSMALFEDRNEKYLKGMGAMLSPEEASKLSLIIINHLRDIAKIRESHIRYKSVIKTIDKVSPSEYNGILQQLVCDMVDVRKPDMPDLKYRSSGLKDLLKSGLSMLINTTTKNTQNINISKHPFDNQTVIIFIVGGTTVDECFQMHKNIMISGTDVNVLIGSTNFVNPIEATKQVLLM